MLFVTLSLSSQLRMVLSFSEMFTLVNKTARNMARAFITWCKRRGYEGKIELVTSGNIKHTPHIHLLMYCSCRSMVIEWIENYWRKHNLGSGRYYQSANGVKHGNIDIQDVSDNISIATPDKLVGVEGALYYMYTRNYDYSTKERIKISRSTPNVKRKSLRDLFSNINISTQEEITHEELPLPIAYQQLELDFPPSCN